MGSYECYCAFCAGRLGTGVAFGLNTKRARAWRLRYIDMLKRRNAGEDVPNCDNKDDPMQDGKRSGAKSEGVEDRDEENAGEQDLDVHEEWRKYAPEVISEEDVAWLENCRCLGYNKDAVGSTKAYISGRGAYRELGSFYINEPGNDPNDPREGEYICYMSIDAYTSPVYPFHETCLNILSRPLFKMSGIDEINKDVLYSAMSQLYRGEWDSTLDLDYGLKYCGEQFWTCQLGEEWVACDPSFRPEAEEQFRSLITRKFASKPAIINFLGDKVRSDPFEKLPYDILYMIFPFLDKRSTFALMQASSHILSSTQDEAFWKQMIRLDILPWLWELNSVLKAQIPDLDYKGFFLWLEKNTEGELGMEGPYMGLANRRRIWGLCGAIADEYQHTL